MKKCFFNTAIQAQTERTALARVLLEMRILFKNSCCFTPSERAAHLRDIFAQRRALVPQKPTRENLIRRIKGLEEYSQSRGTSHDTEYYSACGWDDYQCELRDDARKEAKELRAMLNCS